MVPAVRPAGSAPVVMQAVRDLGDDGWRGVADGDGHRDAIHPGRERARRRESDRVVGDQTVTGPRNNGRRGVADGDGRGFRPHQPRRSVGAIGIADARTADLDTALVDDNLLGRFYDALRENDLSAALRSDPLDQVVELGGALCGIAENTCFLGVDRAVEIALIPIPVEIISFVERRAVGE
jgi:hypothetical protein